MKTSLADDDEFAARLRKDRLRWVVDTLTVSKVKIAQFIETINKSRSLR